VYGSIIGLALIVAIEAHPPGPVVVDAWLLGTAVAVGLAEMFSEMVGIETSNRRRVTPSEWRHMAEDALAVAFGVAFPAVFFLLAAIGVFSVGAAFTLAKWTGVGLIGCYGYLAARLAGEPTHRALVKALLVALVGAAVIGLKALVH
jgi:hypothetical protein